MHIIIGLFFVCSALRKISNARAIADEDFFLFPLVEHHQVPSDDDMSMGFDTQRNFVP